MYVQIGPRCFHADMDLHDLTNLVFFYNDMDN